MEHPIWVAVLLQLGVCPVLNVAAACWVVNLIVVLVVVPVDATRSEVSTCKRVPEVAGSCLVLRVLVAVLSRKVDINVVEHLEVDLRVEVVAAVCVLRSHAVREYIAVREVSLEVLATACKRYRVVCCETSAEELLSIVL